ncbi:MAG: hypothetical protein FWD17_10920, partial [Polyangiaceae bacterium]|nr:hypothetical protein [Polyangiaceae bacterium]
MQFASCLRAPLALAFGVLASASLAAYGCSGGSSHDSTTPPDAGTDGIALVVDANRADVNDAGDASESPGSSGPDDSGPPLPPQSSGTDAGNGRQVFRFETFGNEGFWTHVAELPQGIAANNMTPAQALGLGLSIDIDNVPAALAATIQSQIGSTAAVDPNSVPALLDPANMSALIEANAVLGLVARNVTAPNGQIDINASDVFAGEAVGISCAFCHSITDGSVLDMPSGGSIGHRLDGPSNHALQVGQIFALANHSIALYPMLGLHMTAGGDTSITRLGPYGLVPLVPAEADVDNYLNDPRLNPVGTFDDQPDTNGAPMHIMPAFRQDLAAPYGTEGSFDALESFSNYKYTVALDPTDLLITTPAPNQAGAMAAGFSGPKYLLYEKLGPDKEDELLTKYKSIIETQLGIPAFAAGNDGYPYVGRAGACVTAPAGVENEPSQAGLQCDRGKLLDLNSYLFSLHPPPGVKTNTAAIAQGRQLFREQCTQCHDDDQSLPVPQNIVPYDNRVDLFANAPARPALYPGWIGNLILTRPGPPFAPLVPAKDYPKGTFDDKLIFTEASNHGQPRGSAMPLLMDLARKPTFLHDDEVTGSTPTDALNTLLEPNVTGRDTNAPHPFFMNDAAQRTSIITFLQSLDDTPLAAP